MANHVDPNPGGKPEPAAPQGRVPPAGPSREPMVTTNNASNRLSAPLKALLPERHLKGGNNG